MSSRGDFHVDSFILNWITNIAQWSCMFTVILPILFCLGLANVTVCSVQIIMKLYEC